MVKINLELDLTEEQIEKELNIFFNKGLRWRRCGWHGNDCQIWAPRFFIEEESLLNYFEHLKKLEAGNEKQLEMLEILNLYRNLFNTDNHYFWNSDYFTNN